MDCAKWYLARFSAERAVVERAFTMWLLVCATLAVIVVLVYWALRSAAPAADKAAAPPDDDWAAQLSPAVAELIDPLVSLDHLQGLPAEDVLPLIEPFFQSGTLPAPAD